MAERLHIFEEKERLHKESLKKSKQRPEYKILVKEYNKRYYQKKKDEKKTQIDTSVIYHNDKKYQTDKSMVLQIDKD